MFVEYVLIGLFGMAGGFALGYKIGSDSVGGSEGSVDG